jgi:hypothetical protein
MKAVPSLLNSGMPIFTGSISFHDYLTVLVLFQGLVLRAYCGQLSQFLPGADL